MRPQAQAVAAARFLAHKAWPVQSEKSGLMNNTVACSQPVRAERTPGKQLESAHRLVLKSSPPQAGLRGLDNSLILQT